MISLAPSAHKCQNIELSDPAVGAAEFLEDGNHQFCAVGIKFGMLGVPARLRALVGEIQRIKFRGPLMVLSKITVEALLFTTGR